MIRYKIIKEIKNIEVIPVYATKALESLAKDEVDIKELVSIFEMDPALTANILRIVNSVKYAGDNHILTVQDAAVRLGTRALLDLVIGSSVRNVLNIPIPGYDLPAGSLWRSAVSTGVLTGVVADHINFTLPHYAFTAGLLHDIGKIVLGQFVHDEVKEILNYSKRNNMAFYEGEQEILGIDHAEVGALLLESWNLPEELILPVRYHHCPDEINCEDDVTCIIHIADSFTILIGSGVGMDGLMYRVSSTVTEKYRVNASSVESIICKGISKISEMEQLISN